MIKNTFLAVATIAACSLAPWGLYELLGKAGLILYAVVSGGLTLITFCACAANARRRSTSKYHQTILK